MRVLQKFVASLPVLASLTLLSCSSRDELGGATATVEKSSGGNSLTVSAGTFDTDISIAFSSLGEAGLNQTAENKGATVSLEQNDKLETAVEITFGDGQTNVTLKKNLSLTLTTSEDLRADVSAMARAASLQTYAAIFCAPIVSGSISAIQKFEGTPSVSAMEITFAFGKGETVSGFLCLLLINQNNDAPAFPLIESGATVIPTGTTGS